MGWQLKNAIKNCQAQTSPPLCCAGGACWQGELQSLSLSLRCRFRLRFVFLHCSFVPWPFQSIAGALQTDAPSVSSKEGMSEAAKAAMVLLGTVPGHRPPPAPIHLQPSSTSKPQRCSDSWRVAAVPKLSSWHLCFTRARGCTGRRARWFQAHKAAETGKEKHLLRKGLTLTNH